MMLSVPHHDIQCKSNMQRQASKENEQSEKPKRKPGKSPGFFVFNDSLESPAVQVARLK